MDVVWFGGFRLRLLVMAAEAEAAAGLGLISWLVGRSCSTGSDAPPLSLNAAAAWEGLSDSIHAKMWSVIMGCL